jgi:outer membrane lipoprotein-sorting protein
MRKLRRHAPVAIALILASLSGSCGLFVRNRPILRGKKAANPTQTLMVATRDELNDRIARLYNAIDSFQATVDMTPSVGSVYKGQITEYKDVRAFVLFRKPADIRIIGQAPVIRTKVFDMVSNGADFRFFLVQSNLFVQGANNAPPTSKSAIENLRPDAFLSSMLIRPADPKTETIVLEDATDEEDSNYILYFMRKDAEGRPVFGRTVWFSRIDLSIVRQKVLDDMANILSDTRYAKWQPFNNISFPSHIDLNRPKDGYGVVMDIVQVQMNKELPNDQFVLTQPEGSKLQVIGTPVSERR